MLSIPGAARGIAMGIIAALGIQYLDGFLDKGPRVLVSTTFFVCALGVVIRVQDFR
jgi:hypothetical protein